MPLVDRRTDTVVLRIVYDGPPEAGKTTNVQQLCERISLNRRGELSSPGNQERTQFFDWLEVAGGYVQGRRIRCQLVSVPGQPELLRRRRYLLESADAVVFVADSRALALELNQKLTGELISILGKVGGERPARVVLQANKQDLPEAVDPQALRVKLGLDPETCALAAQAFQGVGVLETLTVAVRLAVERVRALVLSGAGIDERAASEEPGDLLRALRVVEQTALDLIPLAPTTDPTPPPIELLAPSAVHAGDLPPMPSEVAEPAKVPSSTSEAVRSASVVPLHSATIVPTPHSSILGLSLPHADIPPGFVWPPMQGRAALREIAASSAEPTADVPWRTKPFQAFLYGAQWLAETADTDCYPDVDAARHALLAHIADTLALGSFAPEGRILTITQEPKAEGRAFLWTLTRAVRPLIEQLSSDVRDGARKLCKRAIQVLEALHALKQQEKLKMIRADAGVDGLALQGERVCYAGPVSRNREGADHETRVSVLARRISDACVDAGLKEDVALELSAARGELEGELSASVDTLVSRLSEEISKHSLVPGGGTSFTSLVPTMIPYSLAAIPEATAAERILQVVMTPLTESPRAAEATSRAVEIARGIAMSDERPELEVPPEDVPSGFVWPPVLGRAALSGFAEGRKIRVPAVASWSPRNAIELRSDSGYLAHTTPHWCFDDKDAARLFLSEQVRRQMWLSDFVPARRAFAVGAQDESFRLWVLTPSLTSVRELFRAGFPDNDGSPAVEVLLSVLRTLIELADAPFEVALRPRLEHLALQDGRVVYLGIAGESADTDDASWCAEVAESFRVLSLEHAVVERNLSRVLGMASRLTRESSGEMVAAIQRVAS